MTIVPIHTHSMYSSLDGFSTPEEIAQRIADLGCPCCGLTDHGAVTGHLHFDKALRAKGIQPIFGCELYHGNPAVQKGQRDQDHLIALAQNSTGLKNLWSLVTATSDEAHFHHVGRVFWDDLQKYNEGLIVTSACALGKVPKGLLRDDYEPLNRYLDIFGDRFFIEIHTYPIDQMFNDKELDFPVNMRIINEALISAAMERGIPMVYANDAHYAFPWQYDYHDLYLATATRDSIYTPIEERSQWHPPEALSIMDEAGVRSALSYLPPSVVDEAIDNSLRIAEMCTAELPSVERHMPVFVPSECPWLDDQQKEFTPEELFIELVELGILDKYGEDASREVWERVVYEVETLIHDGIHHYFLMGWDEMQAAMANWIETGPGRGSSAGCIVSYALGVTDVDPLHYGLIFERFWNSGRADGFPDIDTDFSRAKRQKMIEYLEERWGKDRVCAIGTVGYMKPKAVIDKLYKGCGMDFKEAEELKKIVGQTTKIEILGHDQIGWTEKLEPGKKYYVEKDVGAEILTWIGEKQSRQALRERFVKMCQMCCSRVEQYGIHASGIVISDVPLADELPSYRRGGKEKGKPATMFAMKDVDNRKFIKLDVLGLRTLDVLETWRMMMLNDHDILIQWSGMDKEEHPEAMWDLLHDGLTAGIFQVEDGYGRQLCKGMDPRSVEDLAVIVALNRPGPIQAKIPEEYIARRKGDKPVEYLHPRMEELIGPILDPTYGLFVYQEQIIAFFNALDFTLSESDAMRKIMGKKTPEQLAAVRDGLEEWEGRGYIDMAQRAGLPLDVAEKVWAEIEGFADYCFNKSHAVAYAIIGFRTLFAKFYGPAQFYAACMASLDHSTDGDKRKAMVPQYVNECRRQDIEVLPPDIVNSRAFAHATYDGWLQFGFYDVKGVGNSGEYIEELVRGVHWNRDADISTPDLFLGTFEKYNQEFLKLKKTKVIEGEWDPKTKSPKQQLQANKITALEGVGAWPNDMTMTERQQAEMEYLGVIVSDNSDEVIERNQEEIAATDTYDTMLMPFDEKPEWNSGDEYEYFEYTICGIVTEVQEKVGKKSGKPFGLVTVEYGHDAVEFVVFSSRWRSHKFLFKLRNVGIFTIKHAPPSEYGESYQFSSGHLLK